jgi:LSD1 subclass zinc finger protein
MARSTISASINLVDLMEQFPTDEHCRTALENLRWADGVRCPRCNGVQVYPAEIRNQYECHSCRYQFSVTSGTIFHDTHLPLRKWFTAIYLTVESKKGVSANQMKRVIGVSYKTAWYLCHRIRAALTELDPTPLKGIVEVDETFVGGRLRGHGLGRGAYLKNKGIVIGVIQRGGKVRLQVIDRTDRKTLHRFIKENTAPDTEVIITDDWKAYRGIADYDTKHEVVNHSAKEYVRGDIHTNGIENVWSLLKRSVTGTYHKLSVKHLDAYLDELEWRFNNRDNPYLFRDTLIKLLGSKNVEYQDLIAS